MINTCFSKEAIFWQTFYYISLMNVLYYVGDRKINGTNRPSLWKTITLSSFNYFCLGVGVWTHSCVYGHTDTELWYIAVAKLIGCRFLVDVWFYTIHRLFHTKQLYKYHKVHHEWKQPISYATFYAHPLENIFANLGTILVSLHTFQLSHSLAYFWILLVVTQSVVSHSGDITFFVKSKHDYHHMYLNCAFGNDLFMDKIFKTAVSDFDQKKLD